MENRLFLVRHCQAEGQEFEAKLTDKGIIQAQKLAQFFADVKIDRIISSPFKRAMDSISPLADIRGIDIEVDMRLSERVLSKENLNDWQEKLRHSFANLDITYPGGESSRAAMDRGLEVINHLQQDHQGNIVIMTHGNLMALILKAFQPSFGYSDWKELSNPDVYVIESSKSTINRLWK